jgi:hypothetical protein
VKSGHKTLDADFSVPMMKTCISVFCYLVFRFAKYMYCIRQNRAQTKAHSACFVLEKCAVTSFLILFLSHTNARATSESAQSILCTFVSMISQRDALGFVFQCTIYLLLNVQSFPFPPHFMQARNHHEFQY